MKSKQVANTYLHLLFTPLEGIYVVIMLSSSKFASVGRRCFRSVPDNINLSHPRLAIAKNILKLRKITDANCEASVRAALKDSVSVEDVAAQPCLTAFEINLLSTTAKTYHAPFVRSTLVWQNQPFLKYVYNEFMKLENFGFLVGFA